MSRGGRGGSTGVRAVASALGISRQDIGSYTRLNQDQPLLYPPIGREVSPLEASGKLDSMVEIKERFINRFHLSHFYQDKRGSKEITRYTDKYKKQKSAKSFDPDFSRLPANLNWKQKSAGKKPAKIRKVDEQEVFKRLEEKADEIDNKDEVEAPNNEEEDASDAEEQQNKDDEEELSDEDYQEEDNDYVANYFDNGEGMGNSDDDLEEGNTY